MVSVKALNGVSDAGERRQERELAQAGEVLRKAELVSFQSALVDAKAMSAPNTLRDWIEDKFHELSKPAVESPDERADSKVHPDVDSTLAVLDESARLAKAFQSKSTLIRSWILLADGPDSLWYHDLGAYIATSREEPISGIDPAGLEADANHLLSHRPASVPPNIVTDLELLGDSRHVATITHHSIGTEFRILTALIGAPWNR